MATLLFSRYIRKFSSTCVLKNHLIHNPLRVTSSCVLKRAPETKITRQSKCYSKRSSPSSECDVLVLGGGAVGLSVAYHVLAQARGQLRVMVVERDPTYTRASTVLSLGGIRQQYTWPENVQLSLYGAHFFRHASSLLRVEGEDAPDLQFREQGYLLMAPEERVWLLEENYKLQCDAGAKVQLMTAKQLQKKYPWLNIDGIGAGVEGVKNEGRFDPWALVLGLRAKAVSLGAEYVQGSVAGLTLGPSAVTHAQIQLCGGEEVSVGCGTVVLACGAWSGQVAAMAGIGTGQGILATPLNVYPRKRYVFIVHVPGLSGENTPIFIDQSGAYFKSEGRNTHRFTVGKSPREDQEPPINDLEVDYSYFDEQIWPLLAHRVPAFENLKVEGGWAGYYDYHTLDQNPIIGPHPAYPNMFIVTGFSGHGAQHAAGAGRAAAEHILHGKFCSVDLRRFSFERAITGEAVKETNVW